MEEVSLEAAWSKLGEMLQGAIRLLPNVAIALVVFTVFWFAARFARRLVRRLTRHHKNARNLGLVLGRLVQGIMLLIGGFVALSTVLPSLQPGDLVQLLGVSGVAIGFAFRDILQNFLAGILILLTEPFEIDDQIVFKGFEGTVEEIQTRATVMRTYDGRRVVIPNAELFTNSVTVNTAFERRRFEYDLGIGYGDDVERAKHLILEVLGAIDGVLKDPPPEALMIDLAESSINIRVRWWVSPPRRSDQLEARDRVLMALNRTLVANGIDLPYPTRQILFHDQTEAVDGDRQRQREGWPADPKASSPRSRQQLQTAPQASPQASPQVNQPSNPMVHPENSRD